VKRGHVTGTKKETTGLSWLMQTPEYEAEIQRLEREWQAKQEGQGK
jgi:hypothetical protein